jgi:hypothetical protein
MSEYMCSRHMRRQKLGEGNGEVNKLSDNTSRLSFSVTPGKDSPPSATLLRQDSRSVCRPATWCAYSESDQKTVIRTELAFG